jgi:hypothetical protein
MMVGVPSSELWRPPGGGGGGGVIIRDPGPWISNTSTVTGLLRIPRLVFLSD